MILGKPLFIWFGILGGISVILAVTSGLMHAKMNTHKLIAFIAVIFIALHLVGVFGLY